VINTIQSLKEPQIPQIARIQTSILIRVNRAADDHYGGMEIFADPDLVDAQKGKVVVDRISQAGATLLERIAKPMAQWAQQTVVGRQVEIASDNQRRSVRDRLDLIQDFRQLPPLQLTVGTLHAPARWRPLPATQVVLEIPAGTPDRGGNRRSRQKLSYLPRRASDGPGASQLHHQFSVSALQCFCDCLLQRSIPERL
jgi:hypothetical protein